MYCPEKTCTLLAFILCATLLTAAGGNSVVKTCYTCEGINCLRTSLQKTEQCLDALDYCVTIFDKFDVVRKGCSLEISIEYRRYCDANMPECHKCNTDRCNVLGQESSLCIQCDSSKDANCALSPTAIAPSRCAAPTAQNSYCYVEYSGSRVKRGCALSVAAQKNCEASGDCALCMSSDIMACNNVDFPHQIRKLFKK